jgi:hypothetical protein
MSSKIKSGWKAPQHRRKKTMTKMTIAIAVLFLFAAGPSLPGFSMEPSASPPQVNFYQEIPYVSGGIGVEERETVEAIGKEHNLKLTFALQNGNYLGDVNVVVKDNKGSPVLEAVSDGPLFFAKLPAGSYTIEATTREKNLKHTARISARGQTQVHFVWVGPNPETAGQDGLTTN